MDFQHIATQPFMQYLFLYLNKNNSQCIKKPATSSPSVCRSCYACFLRPNFRLRPPRTAIRSLFPEL